MESKQLLIAAPSKVGTCVAILPSQLRSLNKYITSKTAIVATVLVLSASSCNSTLIKDYGQGRGKINLNSQVDSDQKTAITKIRGRVIDDQDGQAILFGSIKVIGSDLKTETDLDGNFELDIPAKFQKGQVVQFGYVGYSTIEIQLDQIIGKTIIVQMSGISIGYLELIE